jgi:hypothetical protein
MRTRIAGVAAVGLVLALLMLSAAHAAEAEAKPPRIQMAILLDNSGSMGGLIQQAKTELWSVVNEFATTKKNGQIPALQVALYTYGSPPPAQRCPLTTNLDLVSEKLFAVAISGGTEYCGLVIQTAVGNLKWSDSNEDFKVIFIAGNERFTQGKVDYRTACKAAIEKGIIVNTIHCGSEQAGIDGKWKDGAMLADGRYMVINQNRQVAHVNAPQDKKIAELNAKLNTTYVPYGARGKESAARQATQDANSKGVSSSSLAQRAAAKASAQYRNTSWDLVDAVRENKVKLAEVKEEELPEAMQKMTPAERRGYVEEQAKERAKLQKQIRELYDKRTEYVKSELKKRGESKKDTLGEAMRKAVRDQAAKRDFQIKCPPTVPGTRTEPEVQ